MNTTTTTTEGLPKVDPYAKRFHVRVKVESYSGVLNAPEGLQADLVDISLGGLGFVTRDALVPANDVYLSFTLPDLTGTPFVFHVKGSLIHSTYVKRHEGYLNGFEYGYLTPTQDEVLRHYISMMLKNRIQELRVRPFGVD